MNLKAIRTRVANLMLYAIIYAEEYITEYLDGVLLSFQRELVKHKNVQINQIIARTLTYLGRFCDYEALTKLVYPTIKV